MSSKLNYCGIFFIRIWNYVEFFAIIRYYLIVLLIYIFSFKIVCEEGTNSQDFVTRSVLFYLFILYKDERFVCKRTPN